MYVNLLKKLAVLFKAQVQKKSEITKKFHWLKTIHLGNLTICMYINIKKQFI